MLIILLPTAKGEKPQQKARNESPRPERADCTQPLRKAKRHTRVGNPKKISPRNGKSVYDIAAVTIFDVLNRLTEEQKQTPKTCNYLLQTTPPERMSLQ